MFESLDMPLSPLSGLPVFDLMLIGIIVLVPPHTLCCPPSQMFDSLGMPLSPLSGLPVFDLMLIGMGADGHTIRYSRQPLPQQA